MIKLSFKILIAAVLINAVNFNNPSYCMEDDIGNISDIEETQQTKLDRYSLDMEDIYLCYVFNKNDNDKIAVTFCNKLIENDCNSLKELLSLCDNQDAISGIAEMLRIFYVRTKLLDLSKQDSNLLEKLLKIVNNAIDEKYRIKEISENINIKNLLSIQSSQELMGLDIKWDRSNDCKNPCDSLYYDSRYCHYSKYYCQQKEYYFTQWYRAKKEIDNSKMEEMYKLIQNICDKQKYYYDKQLFCSEIRRSIIDIMLIQKLLADINICISFGEIHKRFIEIHEHLREINESYIDFQNTLKELQKYITQFCKQLFQNKKEVLITLLKYYYNEDTVEDLDITRQKFAEKELDYISQIISNNDGNKSRQIVTYLCNALKEDNNLLANLFKMHSNVQYIFSTSCPHKRCRLPQLEYLHELCMDPGFRIINYIKGILLTTQLQGHLGIDTSFRERSSNYCYWVGTNNSITQFCEQLLLANCGKVLINLINYSNRECYILEKEEHEGHIVQAELKSINNMLSEDDVKQNLINVSNKNNISLEELIKDIDHRKYHNLDNIVIPIKENISFIILMAKLQKALNIDTSFQEIYNNYAKTKGKRKRYYSQARESLLKTEGTSRDYIIQFCEQLLANGGEVLINLINYPNDKYNSQVKNESYIVHNELKTINDMLSKEEVQQNLINISNEKSISLETLLEDIDNRKYHDLDNDVLSLKKLIKEMISRNKLNDAYTE